MITIGKIRNSSGYPNILLFYHLSCCLFRVETILSQEKHHTGHLKFCWISINMKTCYWYYFWFIGHKICFHHSNPYIMIYTMFLERLFLRYRFLEGDVNFGKVNYQFDMRATLHFLDFFDQMFLNFILTPQLHFCMYNYRNW